MTVRERAYDMGKKAGELFKRGWNWIKAMFETYASEETREALGAAKTAFLKVVVALACSFTVVPAIPFVTIAALFGQFLEPVPVPVKVEGTIVK